MIFQVEYLVFKDTIDEWIANLLVRKAKIIEHLLSARTSSISDSSTTFKLGFGKYKGCILDEVPIEYINNFLIKQGIYKSNRCLWIALVDGEYLNEQPTILENELLSSRVRYSFDFGRYNGMEWNQVPADYRDWILKEKIWKSFKRRTLWLALYEVGVVGDNPSVINNRREFGFEGGEEV